METNLSLAKHPTFHRLKVNKKELITKNTFLLEFEIPSHIKEKFKFQAGQYVSVKYIHKSNEFINDFSITSAPYEKKISLGIKINSEESSTKSLFENYRVDDEILVSEPKGRFTLTSKPAEFRTILGFAAGIGITPIFSHFKNILHNEPRTRMLLFYGNKNKESIIFRNELEELQKKYNNRLEIYYFFSEEKIGNALFEGRLDERKLNLIINQLLMIDDTDEEVTLWDSVDEVLICGKGEMIKEIANASFNNGLPKRNIHFELFEEYNDNIFPVEMDFPLIENIKVEFIYNGKTHKTTLKDNKDKLLQSLSIQKFNVPFSCKSGICGTCECKLVEGDVKLIENEYLTEKEEQKGNILACMSFALSNKIKINFDQI